jgi:magnesium transporter
MRETRFYHVPPGGGLVPTATPTEAVSAAKEGGYVWLDFCEPTRDDLSCLIDLLGIHPLSIEDCFDTDQIPKIDDFPRHAFLLFNAFDYSGGSLSLSEVDVFIGGGFLVTVAGRDAQGRRLLDGLERTVGLDMNSVHQGPAFLLHVVLDRIVDRKFTAIEALEEGLDAAEEAILADLPGFEPSTLLHLRRDLLAQRKSLFHEREILVKICRRDCSFIGEQALFFYRDIYDHLAKFFELTETSREISTSLMEMYLSMLNNQMTRVANDTNTTVRRLTFITTIFMPLGLLAGIGGMSEWSMMTGPSNWPIAYPVFIVILTAIGIVNYYLFKRLERRGPWGRRSSKANPTAADRQGFDQGRSVL